MKDDYGNKIRKLEKDHAGCVTDIVDQIFNRWINGNGAKPVSWARLVVCLRSAELNRLADKIESAYCEYPKEILEDSTHPWTIYIFTAVAAVAAVAAAGIIIIIGVTFRYRYSSMSLPGI